MSFATAHADYLDPDRQAHAYCEEYCSICEEELEDLNQAIDGKNVCMICFHKLVTGKPSQDPVNHPSHYTGHPSGIEAIEVTQHFNFNMGNAIKYVWRADMKGKALEDLEKARWYIDQEIKRRKSLPTPPTLR